MVVAVGMRGFLNIEGMMPNFLLTHPEVSLLCVIHMQKIIFVDFSFSYTCLLWHIFPKIQLPV